jgi:hypothetical protein
MNAFEELEQSLTVDQAQPLVDRDSVPEIEGPSSTQQLLDEMLGRFEDDDSTMLLAHSLSPEVYAGSDE